MNSFTSGRIAEVNVAEQYIVTMRGNNFNSAIRFNIAPETIIINRFNRRIPLSRLEPASRVHIRHANFMTMSIPPQTTAFVIRGE